MKYLKILSILFILILPSYSLMFMRGIYTMHDFHIFRIQQYAICIQEFSFPCRWAVDAGRGYGEPLFNFYGQLPYIIAMVFNLILDFSILDSGKIMFTLTLLGSAVAMFLWARRYWGNFGGLVSALFYTYAPYRSVDVWVRGALNESLSFVFFPLILWAIEDFIVSKKLKVWLTLALLLAGFILNHNLSVIIFAPFAGVWALFKLTKKFNIHTVYDLLSAGVFSLLLTSFYWLPVVMESHLVSLAKTTQDYYAWQIHFATLHELFISRFWGYGASVWGPVDDMSFSIGQINWLSAVAALILSAYLYIKNKSKDISIIVLSFLLGLFAAFLTHGKSEFLWKLIPGVSYIQFPWRFLMLVCFFWSFTVGSLSKYIPRFWILLFVVLCIVSNGLFFKYDIWRNITDREQFSGELWDEARSSAFWDFWPVTAKVFAKDFAFPRPYLLGSGWVGEYKRGAHVQSAWVGIDEANTRIVFPLVYFPGWQVKINNQIYPVVIYKDLGLISIVLPKGAYKIDLRFTNTWPRNVGNGVSFISFLVVCWLSTKILWPKQK